MEEERKRQEEEERRRKEEEELRLKQEEERRLQEAEELRRQEEEERRREEEESMYVMHDDIDGDEPLDASLAAKQSLDETLASNNWVISGKYTNTGRPLLASDPHLGSGLPSFWVIQHLEFK